MERSILLPHTIGKRGRQAGDVAENPGVDAGFGEGDGFEIAVAGVFDHHRNGLDRGGGGIGPGVGKCDENIAAGCVGGNRSAGRIGKVQRTGVCARYDGRFGSDGSAGDRDGVADDAGSNDLLAIFEGAGAAAKNDGDGVTSRRIQRKRRAGHIVGDRIPIKGGAVGDIDQVSGSRVKNDRIAQG